jgi:uncharacterized protein
MTENEQLLRSIFAELAQGNTRAMSEAMAEEFRWVFPGSWSWSGVWEPKQRVLDELLIPLMGQFESYRSEAERVIAAEDDVIVRARALARTKRGQDYPQSYCYIFRVAHGQLTEVVEYCDTALVERVLKPPALRSGHPFA